MTITQTVEIPADRKLTITVPPEVPTGKVILTFMPAEETIGSEIDASTDEALASARNILTKHLPAFKELAK
ncbi:MAG: hypothetical protein FWG77_10675 [Treponema sp.]|nr:hypothetical protein [Treponema sp.]